MPGFLYNVGATATCTHGGPIAALSTTPRVLVMGMPATTIADQFVVAGCAFNVSGAPHPCVKVQWLVPAARVLINGQPAVLQTSVGLGIAADQAPQGPPIVVVTQTRVIAI